MRKISFVSGMTTRRWLAAAVSLIVVGTFLPTLHDAVGAASACTSSGSPTVTTDKPDYSPNDTVHISGTGYACGSTVTVSIIPPNKTPWSTTAGIGDDGVLTTTYTIPSKVSDSVGEYFLSVFDWSGSLLASMRFTDTHFRYGTISWTRKNPVTRTVDFTIQAAFRRGFYLNCQGNLPNVGDVIAAGSPCGPGSMNFGDGTTAPFGLTVTNVDAANDIIQGFTALSHTYSGTQDTFTAAWQNCCRVSTLKNNADQNWNVQTLINLNTSSGAVQSPNSLLPAQTPCTVGTVCTFPIPASDPDPRVTALTYRLSTPAEMGGAALTQPPGAAVNASSGVFTWQSPANGAAGDIWSASVVIEARNAQGVVIATAQVDFLIKLITAVPPVFVSPPSPTTGSTISAPVGSPLNVPLRAMSPAGYNINSIGSILTISGTSITCGAPATPLDCTFTWTPTLSDVGPHLVGFVAQDATGARSATLQVTIDVPPVKVYVTPDNKNITYGDPDPDFTFSQTGFLGTDTFTTAPTCGVTGAHSNFGTYTITCSGGVAPFGYAIIYNTATLSVGKATVTITPNNQTIVYGDTPTYTYNVSGLVSPDTLTTQPTCGIGVTNPGVGDYTITCSGAVASSNYTIAYGTAKLSVGQRTLTVKADDITVTYGDPQAFTFTTTGFVSPDAFITAPTCDVAGTHSDAGSYTITCSGGDAGANYKIVYQTGSLTVVAKGVLVTADDVTVTYGDPQAFTFHSTGFLNGDTFTTPPTCDVSGPHADAGTYVISCSGATASKNYSISYSPGTLTVNPKQVLVTADNQSITYGDADPAFTFHVSGFVGTDGFTTDPQCGVAVPHTNVGSYPITCSGGVTSANYTVKYARGTLTVAQKQLVITPDNKSKASGDPDPQFTWQVTGLVGTDTLTTNPTCGVSVPHDLPGDYPITCYGAKASKNYVIAYGPNGTLTVRKATPNLSTSPSVSVPVGGLISDTAYVSGAANPSGTVTFNLYAPGDTNCQTSIATRTVTLSGGSANSGTVQAKIAGTYYWVATYNGDARNEAVTADCGSEQVIVTPQVLTGRAYAVSAKSALAGFPLLNVKPTPDTGAVSTTSSGTVAPPCVATIPGIAGVQAACASVTTVGGFGATSTGKASLAAATISVATLPAIVVQGVQATSSTSCAGSTGNVTIDYLKVGGTVLISKPTVVAPNTKVAVGGVRLVLNEQVPFTTPDAGLTVNAIHVSVTGTLTVASLDAVISSAESDISNCP